MMVTTCRKPEEKVTHISSDYVHVYLWLRHARWLQRRL